MSLPIYRGGAAAIPDERRQGNAGLRFERLFDGYDANWEIGETKKDWLQGFTYPVGDSNALQHHALGQCRLATSLGGRHAVFQSEGHFVTGTGYPHPVENGLAWHPVLGTPYLAGSAVKGLLRAWVEQWTYRDDEDEDRRAHLLAWFGSDDKDPRQRRSDPRAGDLVFFDAIPVSPVPLEVAIMTPHMGKWYEQGGDIRDPLRQPERVPADWHDPTPIPFLVARRVSLLFSIAPRNAGIADGIDLDAVMESLRDALQWIGAGAKTAIGYGQMARNTNADNVLETALIQSTIDAQRAEMTEEQRRIDDLTMLLDKERAANHKDAGGPVMQQLAALIKEAVNWPAPERERLATLAESAYKYVGWGKSAKKKARKQAIAGLRAGGTS